MPLRTGIPKMDELMPGGIPEGAAVMITGPLGAEIETFGQQIASSVASSGRCLYFVADKMPSLVREKLTSLRLPAGDNLVFIDGYSVSIGMSTTEQFFTRSSADIDKVLLEAAGKVKPAAIVFDSLSSGIFREGGVKETATRLRELVRSLDASVIFLFSRMSPEDDALAKEMSGGFDSTVLIESVEENFIERSFYTVSTRSDIHVPFKVSAGGISIYVPKIIVTGPYHAGKSTFIHKISTRAVSVDRLGTTVALDHGYMEYGGFSVDLFGTPGQEAFNFILPIIGRDTFGVILITDASDRSCFQRAKDMVGLVSGGRIPYVVAANKSDLPGALSNEEIRSLLGAGEEVPVIRTVSTTGKGLMETVTALFDLITGFRKWEAGS